MDYIQAVEYITKKCAPGIKPGLERVRELLLAMGNPERSFRSIHVTGTNGKGSTSAMLAEILHRAGYRTGLFTSPFIERINEYMRVDGECILDDEYAELAMLVEQCEKRLAGKATEFERSFAMAAEFFRRKGCEICVIEVGMGGRGDATNVIPPPLAAVFTHIGVDHVKFLGSTIEEIALEKSGIIKPGSEVVCYPSEKAVLDIIKAAADGVSAHGNAKIHAADFSALIDENEYRESFTESLCGAQKFSYRKLHHIELSLCGKYQQKNAAVVLEAVEVLRNLGFKITEEHIRGGLAGVRWPARFEILHKRPLFIADGGHNVQCMEALLENFRDRGLEGSIIFIMGVMADKDYVTMLEKMSAYARCIIGVRPENIRSLGTTELGSAAAACGIEYFACKSVDEGVRLSLKMADTKDIICASGTLYMMAQLRRSAARL